jgi:hypothetical protein
MYATKPAKIRKITTAFQGELFLASFLLLDADLSAFREEGFAEFLVFIVAAVIISPQVTIKFFYLYYIHIACQSPTNRGLNI